MHLALSRDLRAPPAPGKIYFAMQSKPLDRGPGHAPAVVLFVFLPIVGFAAELLLRPLQSVMVLFPDWWYVAAAAAALLGNFVLHTPALRGELLPVRALVFGYVAGMAVLYAIVEAPALPLIAVAAFVLLGFLAAAPYWVCIGLLRLWPELMAAWRASGRSLSSLVLIVLVGVTGIPFVAVADGLAGHVTLATMAELHRAVAAGDAERAEALAARLRLGDGPVQLAACAGRFERVDGDLDTWPLLHVGRGERFWFVDRLLRADVTREAARVAFYRAHGREWNEGAGAQHDVEWESARVEVACEPDAALARVDWLARVRGTSFRDREATFVLQIPPGAVATSLSLWIAGEERPAAFGSQQRVTAAYESVVRRSKDPALLRELSPGRLQLRLFPLSRRREPMQVRVGLTVPLHLRDDGAWLLLPEVESHDCGNTVDRVDVAVAGDGPLRVGRHNDATEPILLRRGASLSASKDAQGWVVQRITRRPPVAPPAHAVLVVEASASTAMGLPDPAAVLDAFPGDTVCAVHIAHGASYECRVDRADAPGLRDWLARAPFSGGVDPRAAIGAAHAKARELGLGTIYCVHGTASRPLPGVWIADLDGVEIAALQVRRGPHFLLGEGALRARATDIAWVHDTPADRLLELGRHVALGGNGPFARDLARAAECPAGAVVTSDHLARLWAARAARARAPAEPVVASELAARYRIVTAGAAAVVLETREQYAEHGLDPGASRGREPGAEAGAPVPEPSTWLLLGVGLAAAFAVRRRLAV